MIRRLIVLLIAPLIVAQASPVHTLLLDEAITQALNDTGRASQIVSAPSPIQIAAVPEGCLPDLTKTPLFQGKVSKPFLGLTLLTLSNDSDHSPSQPDTRAAGSPCPICRAWSSPAAPLLL